MKKLFIPLIAVAICLTACDDKKSKLDGYYAEIINEDLRNAIAEYDSIVMKDKTEPYILEVHMESLGDTLTEYYITSGLSGSIFCKNNPILYVANVRGKDVIFFSESITARTNLVHVNNKIEEELKRRNFPALYKKEISGEKFMVTEKLDGLSCHVFFYKGEMIYKKTQVAAIPLTTVAKMIAEKKLKTKESDDAF